MAIVCGLAWGVIAWKTPFSLNLLLAPGAGYAIGEAVSLSVNRKRSTGVAVIGGMAVAISYIVSLLSVSLLFGISFYGVLPLSPFNILYHLIALGLGIFIAITRLR
jgi:hypothetical protein